MPQTSNYEFATDCEDVLVVMVVAAIVGSHTLKPPTIKVIKEIPVDSKQSVERVVRLEAKVSPACRV